jgi:hypothetical protein
MQNFYKPSSSQQAVKPEIEIKLGSRIPQHQKEGKDHLMRATVAGTQNPMAQFSQQMQQSKNYALQEAESNEETDAYSEEQDQIEEPILASKTQNQWKLHNNSLSKRGGGIIEEGAIEECAYEEDLLSNKENKRKKPIQNQTATNGFDYNKNRESLRSRQIPSRSSNRGKFQFQQAGIERLPEWKETKNHGIRVEIQNDERVKQHLLEEVNDKMNLLFYDFNSSQRQNLHSNPYACVTSQGYRPTFSRRADRLPTRERMPVGDRPDSRAANLRRSVLVSRGAQKDASGRNNEYKEANAD